MTAATAPSFKLTAEQEEALRLFLAGKDVVVQAGAGTGKTSTLVALAKAAGTRRGQYLAFNRSLVKDAKTKFPGNVRCHTAHGLAYRDFGKLYEHRLPPIRMKSWELADRLKVAGPVAVEDCPGGERKVLARTFLAGLIMRTLKLFAQTADPAPTRQHVPYIEGIDDVVDGRRRYDNNRIVAAAIEPYLAKAWNDVIHPQGALPYDHAFYLKQFQLSRPRLGVDYILFDEAQDANPVIASIVEMQTHCQRIYVGDSQQQIYAFTGAVDSLEKLSAAGEAAETFLTQSFRFGPAVADVANDVLAMIPSAALRLKGLPSIPSKVEAIEEPSAILTRTNATAVRRVLGALKDEKRPHLVGGASDITSFVKAAARLMNGERVEHPELACFETWQEVREYVEHDEQGAELRLMVDLVDEFGVDTILEALDGSVTEAQADVVISTAHKAKGREWDHVTLAEDFPDEAGKAGVEELRLLYVACTRAKLTLDIEDVALLRKDALPANLVALTPSEHATKHGGQHETPSPGPAITDAEVEAARAAQSPSEPAAAPAVLAPAPDVEGPQEPAEAAPRGKREKVWLSIDNPAEADALHDLLIEALDARAEAEQSGARVRSDAEQAIIERAWAAIHRATRKSTPSPEGDPRD